MLTGEGKAHHGEIIRNASAMVEAGKVLPRVDPRHFTLDDAGAARSPPPWPRCGWQPRYRDT